MLATITSRVAERITRTSPSNDMKRAPAGKSVRRATFFSGLPNFETYSHAPAATAQEITVSTAMYIARFLITHHSISKWPTLVIISSF